MPSSPQIIVAVATLAADRALDDCIASLARQTFRDFEVVVVDNSARGAVRGRALEGVRVIENTRNVGFGAAMNQAFRSGPSEFVATLNDDAVAAPGWLGALMEAAGRWPRAGMFASKVRLSETAMDSAGMVLCADGSSKQRGHGRRPEEFEREEEVLFPSGSAAMYRRAMIEETGGFDDDFFLYCEDTDLGLRGQWAGWTCVYVPGAVVDHRYSHSAGRASPLKAYFVERNRLLVVAKNFPARMIARAPLAGVARYFWTLLAVFQGRGAAGAYVRDGGAGWKLPWIVVRAHLSALAALPRAWRQRRAAMGAARVTAAEFAATARQHGISAREVAAL